MKRPRKPEELVCHKGCKDCNASCLHNKPCTTKSKNQQSADIKYGCNTTKNTVGFISEVIKISEPKWTENFTPPTEPRNEIQKR